MAHCNTIFHQMLKLIPRHHFGKLETEHGTGRKARSFLSRSQAPAWERERGMPSGNQVRFSRMNPDSYEIISYLHS